MVDKLKAGVIGGGFIGAQHVEAVRRLGFAEVIAIADVTQERAEENARATHIERAYGDFAALLADPDVDVIHNCTPNTLHYGINRAALEAGKHVVSEKPLAMDSAETASLVEIARQSGRLAAVNFNYRGYPMVQQARALVGAGELGAVRLVHGSYLQDWLLYESDWNWRLDPAVGGASRAMADIGSHWADLLQHVTGQRITRVLADLQTVVPQRRRPRGAVQTFGGGGAADEGEAVTIRTEDYAAILFQLEGGARGVFHVSQVSAGHKNRLSFEINGSQGSVAWDADAPNELWRGFRDQPNQRVDKDPSLVAEGVRRFVHLPGGHHEAWPDAQKNVIAEMYHAAREGRTAPEEAIAFATFRDGHRAALLIEAVLQSAREGQWVAVPEA